MDIIKLNNTLQRLRGTKIPRRKIICIVYYIISNASISDNCSEQKTPINNNIISSLMNVR